MRVGLGSAAVRIPAAVLVTALVLGLGAVRAQEAPGAAARPLLLRPIAPAAPAQAAPSPAPQTTNAPMPPQAVLRPEAGPGIETRALQSPDVDAIGTLGDGDGGLGAAMWAGTPRRVVDALIARLPVTVTSATMRALMRRLLLTRAAAPEGKGEPGRLVTERVRLLAAMGNLTDVSALLAGIPGRVEQADLLRTDTNAALLTGDNNRACSLARAQIADHDDVFWRETFIFCQVLAREQNKAALGVALLREMGIKDEPFFRLVDGLSAGQAVTLDSLATPTPLHLAIARAAKARLPADVIATRNPALLRAIATSPNAAVEMRLEAAERAESLGALDSDTLRQLYTSVSFTEDQLANPLTRAEAEVGPLSRALLFRTALVQTVPLAQAEAVTRALALARQGGRYASTARAFDQVMRKITPSAALMWFAPEAARAHLVTGALDAARGWLDLLRNGALFDPEAASALARLVPLARLAGLSEGVAPSAEALAAWWTAIGERPDGRDEAQLLFSLFAGLGEDVPESLWEPLMDESALTAGALPTAAVWDQMGRAAEAKRVGETVLAVLLALGDGGPAQAHPIVLRRVVSAIRAVGLEKDARAIALEAAVAAGL